MASLEVTLHDKLASSYVYHNALLTSGIFYCLYGRLCFLVIAGPKETSNPNLDSDQWIVYYACAPRL